MNFIKWITAFMVPSIAGAVSLSITPYSPLEQFSFTTPPSAQWFSILSPSLYEEETFFINNRKQQHPIYFRLFFSESNFSARSFYSKDSNSSIHSLIYFPYDVEANKMNYSASFIADRLIIHIKTLIRNYKPIPFINEVHFEKKLNNNDYHILHLQFEKDSKTVLYHIYFHIPANKKMIYLHSFVSRSESKKEDLKTFENYVQSIRYPIIPLDELSIYRAYSILYNYTNFFIATSELNFAKTVNKDHFGIYHAFARLGLISLLEDSASEFTDTIRNYKRAIELNPTNSRLHFELAFVYELMGNNGKEDAITEYAESLRITPSNWIASTRLFEIIKNSPKLMNAKKELLDHALKYVTSEYKDQLRNIKDQFEKIRGKVK